MRKDLREWITLKEGAPKTTRLYEIKRPTRGYIGLQNHDLGDMVWFKEISARLVDPANIRL